MKILLAVDGSPCSQAAIDEVCTRTWPPGSEVKVFTDVYVRFPQFDITLFSTVMYESLLEKPRAAAPRLVADAAEQIRKRNPGLAVETTIIEEVPPKEAIIEEAERWGADIILIGSHGYGPVKRFLLGSVAHAVVLHAPCSVEVVRIRRPEDAPKAR